MARVAVWINNYNNEDCIGRCISSVLAQTYLDFEIFVFDNHSTDRAPGIIASYKNDYSSKIQVIAMPDGLAGIPAMKFAWEYLNKLDFDYSITLGGHDYWPNPEHLKILVERMDSERAQPQPVAILYCDTWQCDTTGKIVGRFSNIVQQGGNLGRPFIPLWVVSGIDCPPFFGLWNEQVRKQVPVRYTCAGWDHMVVTHAATKGTLMYESRTALIMMAPPPGDGLENYGKRHFSPAALEQGMQDFVNQLEWLNLCIDESCAGMGQNEPFYRAMLTSSMFATYICLRGYNLAVFPGAMEQFDKDPKVREAIQHLLGAANAIRSLTGVTP